MAKLRERLLKGDNQHHFIEVTSILKLLSVAKKEKKCGFCKKELNEEEIAFIENENAIVKLNKEKLQKLEEIEEDFEKHWEKKTKLTKVSL